MLSRSEDPNLDVVLARLTCVHTLVTTQAQNTPSGDSRFCLDAFADILDKTKQALPRLFRQRPRFQNEKLSQWFKMEYDLIHYEQPTILRLVNNTAPTLSVQDINSLYADRARRPDYIQSEHAVILFEDNLYHYNCSTKTPTLERIPEPSESTEKTHYAALQRTLLQRRPYEVYHADQTERVYVAACIHQPANMQARPLHLDMVAAFLTQIQKIAKDMQKEWQRTKMQLIVSSVLTGGAALTVLALQSTLLAGLKYLLTGVVIPTATIVGLAKIALFCAGFIAMVGLGFAVYFHLQERFLKRLASDLSDIKFSQPDANPTYAQSVTEHFATGKPYVATFTSQPLAAFFQANRSALESAFSVENHLRAGISA